MARRLPEDIAETTPPAARPAGALVEAGDRVGDVLDRYPELLDTFLALGFRPLASSVLRRTIARRVTIEQACRLLALDVASVLTALNHALPTGAGAPGKTGEKYSLPLISAN
jgi:hypothetical protein